MLAGGIALSSDGGSVGESGGWEDSRLDSIERDDCDTLLEAAALEQGFADDCFIDDDLVQLAFRNDLKKKKKK
jgi:hypothetical protein